MVGKPSFSRDFIPSSRLLTTFARAVSWPIFVIACLNNSLSSAFLITSGCAPMSFKLYLSRTPLSTSASVALREVCPPTVGSSASGLS